MKFVVRASLAFTLIISFLILPLVSAQEYTVLINETDRAIVLDGKWTTDEEWSDAIRIPMKFNPALREQGYKNGTVHVMVKHNGEYLFVLIDAVSSTNVSGAGPAGGDFYAAFIDPDNEKTDYPMPDDLFIQRTWNFKNGSYWMMNGLGNATEPGWDISNAKKEPVYLEYSMSSSPFSKKQHIVCEMAIPLEDMANQIGFTVLAVNWPKKTVNAWPENWSDNAPNSWGTLIISRIEEPLKTPVPTEPPIPTEKPTSTPAPIETPTTLPPSTETYEVPEVTVSESFITQMPGGYFTVLAMIAIVMIISMMLIKKKSKQK